MKLRTVLNHSFVVMNEANTVYLLVEVEAPSMERPASRRPLNLSIVLDRSGSMAGGKLEHAKSAAAFVVRNLCDEDSISVVTFDDKVDTPVPSRPVVEHEKAEIIRLIEDISCGNTTNLSGGLLMGCYQVRQALSDDRISRVILLSDGQANEGIVNPSILVSKARSARGEGIHITTVGVGDDFNEDLMTALAEEGGGNYYYLPSPEDIPVIFAKELQGLLELVAQNLVIKIETIEGVSGRVYGYPLQIIGGAVHIPLNDIFSGEKKSVFLKMNIPPQPEGTVKVGTVTLSYDDVSEAGGPKTVGVPLELVAVGRQAYLEEPENPEVMEEKAYREAGEALDEAVKRADTGDYGGAAEILSEAARKAREAASRYGSDRLEEEARDLEAQAANLARPSAVYESSTRKDMRYSAYLRRQGRGEMGGKS